MIVEIVFAAGCFWGVEKHFEELGGVLKAESGYTGGSYEDPSYKQVLKYRKLKPSSNVVNHTEAVKVTFDNSKTDAATLIKSFWELHDPTQLNRQGNDRGNNYRSGIFYTNAKQEKIAKETKRLYQDLLAQKGYGKIVTEIKPLTKFYNAEAYHQDYLAKNPHGYCPNHATDVKFTKSTLVKEVTLPLGGKEIIVITAEGYCPYCEKFEQDVSSKYKGTLSLRTVTASSLKNFTIKTELFATPTILFIEDGVELISKVGYIDAKEFYKTLGDFKLGKNSESYNVAFNEGTDGRFCKQYSIFKNTPDGVFVDKLSGEVLFDTRERFNSGTGWLSFYKAADDSTIEKVDTRFGMKRVEVIAKKSGIHLGHVFPKANEKRRFCINATVLDFIPRSEIKE